MRWDMLGFLQEVCAVLPADWLLSVEATCTVRLLPASPTWAHLSQKSIAIGRSGSPASCFLRIPAATGSGMLLLLRLRPSRLVLPVAAAPVDGRLASAEHDPSPARPSACHVISATAAAAAVRRHWRRQAGFRRLAAAQDVTSTQTNDDDHRLTRLNRTAPRLITNAPSINYLLLSPDVAVAGRRRYDWPIAASARPSVCPPVTLFKLRRLMNSWAQSTRVQPSRQPRLNSGSTSKSKLTVHACLSLFACSSATAEIQMQQIYKMPSYRRETRATLCVSWNIVLLLYE